MIQYNENQGDERYFGYIPCMGEMGKSFENNLVYTIN
jgi:hypothetical protein